MSGRLRILVLFGGIPLWGQEFGNIEAIDALVQEAGADCLFVTNRGWGHEAIQPELDRRRLPWTTAPYAGRFGRGFSARQWLRKARAIVVANVALVRLLRRFRPTHIHVCNPEHFLNFLPVLLLTRTPMIYRLGDQVSLDRLAWRFLWRRLIAPRVTEFVCVSQFILHDLRAKLGPSRVSSVIYPRPAARHDVAAHPIPGLDREGFKFVYVGQISEQKGILVLLDCARQVLKQHECSFYIAGDDNPLAEELRQIVCQNGLEEHIRLLGRVNDVDRLLRAGDVHLCPSLWQEPLGQVVLEAKRAARPSVVFPSGGLQELVTDGVDGYVCPTKTAESLRDACLFYLSDPDQARRQGSEAHRSLERLGICRFGELWRAVYERTART